MKKQTVTNMNVGDSSVINENTELIRFEGSNESFFWRTYGDVLNYKCEIVVPPTHQAIYIKDGKLQDILEGGKYRVFEEVKKGFFGIGKKVDATTVDLIFMNRTVKFNVGWGTHTPFSFRDALTNLPITVRASGQFEVRILNPKKFYLEIVGADKDFTIESLQNRLAIRMMSYVGPSIAKVIHDKMLTYIDFMPQIKDIADAIYPSVSEMFANDCGLEVCSFTIASMDILDQEKVYIEEYLAQERLELKEKRETQEIIAELERLSDKEWERNLILKKLELADKEKYYEVLKAIGNSKTLNNNNLGSNFCPKCGTTVSPNMQFCTGCGNRLAGHKHICSNCGKELDSGVSFCPNCGKKL